MAMKWRAQGEIRGNSSLKLLFQIQSKSTLLYITWNYSWSSDLKMNFKTVLITAGSTEGSKVGGIYQSGLVRDITISNFHKQWGKIETNSGKQRFVSLAAFQMPHKNAIQTIKKVFYVPVNSYQI